MIIVNLVIGVFAFVLVALAFVWVYAVLWIVKSLLFGMGDEW